MNAMGTRNHRAAEGSVGNFSGLPAADANIPANLGVGTNEDRMIIGRFDEMYLREGTPPIRGLQEVPSGTLQVPAVHRRGGTAAASAEGISIISGTGLIAPAGF
jgi:hypothetical protein